MTITNKLPIEPLLVTLATYRARYDYKPLPYNIVCPKCGSENIVRKYEKAKFRCKATPIIGIEYIDNTCKCCQYVWITAPLTQKGETK